MLQLLDEKMVSQFGVCKTYEYSCLIGDGTSANISTISFYVVNEGQNDEVAYYRTGMRDQLYPPVTPDEPAA